MAINDKLNRIKEIKEDIKQALIDKGVEVTDEDSFASYANKITNIPMEGGDPYYEELYNLRTNNGTNMTGLFARMSGDSIDLTGLDTSQCTDMSYMFEQNKCNNIDCSGWDVSNVNKADYMFSSCSANINTTGWDTSNWSSLYYLFNFFKGGIDISNWNTGNITNVQYMFSYAKLTDIDGISALKLPKVTSYKNMFDSAECDTTLDLSNWNIDTVTNLSRLFYSTKIKRIDLSNWNTKNVTDMERAFNFSYSSITEELIIPDWDMTNVTSSSSFIGNANELKYIDLSRSNDLTINKIITFIPTRTEAAYGDIAIPADSSQEVIEACIAKYWRPIGPVLIPTSFEIVSELDEVLINKSTKVHCCNINPWYSSTDGVEFISSDEKIASINERGEVIAHALGNVEIYARLKNNPDVVSNTISISVSETDSTPYVIKFKSAAPTPVSSTYHIYVNENRINLNTMDYNPQTKIYTCDVGQEITSVKFDGTYSMISDLIKLDFSGNNIQSLRINSRHIKSIDTASWDTSNMTGMDSMFDSCTSLSTIDTSNWDTSNVTSMNFTFQNCTSLTMLDLTSWNTSQVLGSFCMFKNVPSTCQIYVGPNWTLTESECSFTGTFIRVNPEYYTEYSIDSSTATFNMRSIDSINSGAYLPELSNGYDAVLLTLNDGSITTDLNTEANQVSSIKIYYPEETSYVKFANTKVKEVNHLSGSNITDCTGMFTNCIYLEKADLTSLDSTKVTVDTTMFEGVSPDAEIIFNESWDIPKSDMGIGDNPEQPTDVITDFGFGWTGTGFTYEGQSHDIPMRVEPEGCPTNFTYSYDSNNSYNIEFLSNPDGRFARVRLDFKGETITNEEVTITETYSGLSRSLFFDVYDDESGGDSGDYITGFNVDPLSLEMNVGQDTVIYVYPYEAYKQVNFTAHFENTSNENFVEPSIAFNTSDYEVGSNSIQCVIWSITESHIGTATLVIREENSGIEKRIDAIISEPKPTITDFTISPESLAFSEDNKTATVTITPLENYPVKFSYGIGATSLFDFSKEGPNESNEYIISITATQLYKEEYEPVFYVNEERSGIGKSIPVTIDSENVWVNPNANVKVYYNRADGNYDNIGISYGDGGSGFYNSDDNGQYASIWLQKGESYTITVFSNEDGSTLASGEFTFTEDTNLWLVEGESTLRTEKPSLDDEEETPGSKDPVRVTYICDSCGRSYQMMDALMNNFICTACGGNLLPNE